MFLPVYSGPASCLVTRVSAQPTQCVAPPTDCNYKCAFTVRSKHNLLCTRLSFHICNIYMCIGYILLSQLLVKTSSSGEMTLQRSPQSIANCSCSTDMAQLSGSVFISTPSIGGMIDSKTLTVFEYKMLSTIHHNFTRMGKPTLEPLQLFFNCLRFPSAASLAIIFFIFLAEQFFRSEGCTPYLFKRALKRLCFDLFYISGQSLIAVSTGANTTMLCTFGYQTVAGSQSCTNSLSICFAVLLIDIIYIYIYCF